MSSIEDLARSAAAALALGGSPAPPELKALHRVLDSHLAAKFATANADTRLDARDEAVTRFVDAAATSTINHDSALPYLITIATHVMIDILRRQRVASRQLPLTAYSVNDGDDAIARLIDETATSEAIESLLKDLARRGDHVATRVVNTFLVIAEETGDAPSMRTVATEAGVSHTAVSKVFERLRLSLAEKFPNPGPRS